MIMLPLKSRPMARRLAATLASLVMAVFAVGCSSDSPTEPTQNPGGGGGGGGGATAWNITVTVDRGQVQVNSTEAATVTIRVRDANTGQPPPEGATVQLTTTLGDLNSPGSGIQTGIVQLSGGNATVLLFAGSANGTAIIRAQLENSVGSAQLQITGSETFFLASISPNVGDSDGGEVVRISGGGFVPPVRVLFGNSTGEVLEVTDTLIRARTPALNLQPGQSLTVSVQVTIGFNTDTPQTDTLTNVYTFSEDPAVAMQVFSLSPNSGPNEGGTPVTITGQGFSSPMQVLFGVGSPENFSGVEGTVRSVTNSQIVVDTPAATGFGVNNRDQEVAVLTRNLNTGEGAVLNSAFQYGNQLFITSIAPSIGPAVGGQLVTIFGQGFDEPVAVSLGGVAATPISVTGSEVIARTSAVQFDDCNSDITEAAGVTNIETGATAIGPGYTYEITDLAPFVTTISPTSVTQSGGQTITINGGNFTQPLQVSYNNGIISPTSISSSQIQFSLPPFPDTALAVENCDDDGDGTDGERFITTEVARSIQISIANGCSLPGALNANFLVTPSDQTCRNDAGPPPPPPNDPVASFTATANGLTVSFDNTSTDATSYVWDFGDNTTSNAVDPQHTYAAAGTYTVRLTASGPGGSDTATQNITVSDP